MHPIFLFSSLLLAILPQKPSPSLPELRRELDHAQKQISEMQSLVMRLEEEIARKEIARIQTEIATLCKKTPSQWNISQEECLAFFYEQREILSQIIRQHLPCSIEAQRLLDQILMLITSISDEIGDDREEA